MPRTPPAPILAAALALAAAGAVAGPAAAQPGGSYRQSCRDLSYSGGRLTAQCRTRSGEMRGSRLAADQCRGDIGNDDGVLVCQGAGGRLTGEAVRGGGPDGRGDDGRNGYDRDRGYGDSRGSGYGGSNYGRPADRSDGRSGYGGSGYGGYGYGRDRSDEGGRPRGAGGGGGETPPAGSWSGSCRNAGVTGGVLRAECRDTSGRWRTSTLVLSGCGGDPGNLDGRLVCAGSAPRSDDRNRRDRPR